MCSTALVALFASGWAWAKTVTYIAEKGVGTSRQISEEGCQFSGETCTDRVRGSIVGTPIDNPNERRTDEEEWAGIAGTITTEYSNPRMNTEAGTYTVPTTGNVTLNDLEGGRLFLTIKGKTTGELTGESATFKGTFTASRGTGQFRNVIGGRGDVEFEVTDTGKRSTFKAFLDGSLRRAAERSTDD